LSLDRPVGSAKRLSTIPIASAFSFIAATNFGMPPG
jgi:hypothetical protein